MPWYRCEARGEEAAGAGAAFAAIRFVEAEAADTAAQTVRRSLGRELVRRGVDPLTAAAGIQVEVVMRIDEDEVPGIVAPDMVWMAKA